jgi:hypothetical protein
MAAIFKKPEESAFAWGAEAIGKVINRPPRQTFHLLEHGYLPARKVGGSWVASRQRLLAHLSGEDEAAEGDSAP